VNWHYGFGAAGVGMTLGLVQYVLGQKYLRGAGELKEDSALPEKIADARRKLSIGLVVALGVVLACYGLVASGLLSLVQFAGGLTVMVVAIALLYFVWVIGYVCRDGIERRRITLCALLFFAAAMFWSGFEQAGSSFNLFASDFTDRVIFGHEIPAGWLQSVNAIFIILLAPVMGFVWLKLGARNPSIPVKFALGLLMLGAGFFVLAWGSTGLPERAAGTEVALAAADKVGMRWLVATYFLHTVGELCLSPVGLSSFTKLSPARISGQMMGTWFMALSLGNLIGGLIAGRLQDLDQVELFGAVAAIAVTVGLVFLALARPMNRLAMGVR
jgi:POT family proton-dependent oligopeptide transporter